MEKKCCKCGLSKDLKSFSKNKKKKDGYNSTCKECHSKYRKEHYKINKETVLKQVIKYKEDNPEKYITKFANRKPNKKAGRIIKEKCSNPKCNVIVYISLNDIKNKTKRYCCDECKRWNYHPLNRYLYDIKRRAKKANYSFNLDFNFIKDLLEVKQNNKCAITNVDIEFGNKTILYETPSLDRIDSKKGYTKDNVQWVMLGINYMKMKFSNEELIKTLNLIKENY
jgi:hypothetical protein